MELSTIPDPVDKWQKAVEVAELAEALGYDSLWVYDHFHNVPVPAHETMFECWTTLAAHLPADRAHQARPDGRLLAVPEPRPAGQDHLQHRRDLRRPPDLGHRRRVVRARVHGLRLRVPARRPTASGSCGRPSRSSRRCGREPDVSYQGRHFTLDGAQCDPKPLQQPRPQVLIGGGGEQLTLRVVARLADASNFGGKPHEFTHKCEVLQGALHGRRPGLRRDPEDLVPRGLHPGGRAGDPRRRAPARSSASPSTPGGTGNLVGTPEQVAEKVQAYIDLGCTGFYPWCSDYPETESMRLFAEQVIPEVRRANG